jgi:hypothetical protein
MFFFSSGKPSKGTKNVTLHCTNASKKVKQKTEIDLWFFQAIVFRNTAKTPLKLILTYDTFKQIFFSSQYGHRKSISKRDLIISYSHIFISRLFYG